MGGMVYVVERGSWRYEPTAADASTRSAAEACEVSRDRVDPQLVADVERTVRMASVSLGLATAPKVRWLPKGVPGMRGVVFPSALGEVWVVVQDLEAARDSALHELRHIFQLRDDRWAALDLLSFEQRQADADRFARSWRPATEVKASDGSRLAHKTITQRLDVKASGSGWEIAGYASVFANVPDSYGDVIARGCFARTIKSRPTKFLFEHAVPIGNQIELKEDETGLYGRWSVVDTQAGTDARKLAMAGVCAGLSIGYIAQDTERRRDGVRVVKDVDLYEVSLTAIPAQPLATVTAVKSVSAPIRFDLRAELQRRRRASNAVAARRYSR